MSTYCLLAASVISIHAPREGCDGFGTGDVSGWRYFNPRTPRGVRLDALRGLLGSHLISIHAPREGCDDEHRSHGPTLKISIHAPREGCDSSIFLLYRSFSTFQSTHPARGATLHPRAFSQPLQFQSTHPARGATRSRFALPRYAQISIHAPREGCDAPSLAALGRAVDFNPRTPRGVRPGSSSQRRRTPDISIHAPREGCDRLSTRGQTWKP